MMVPERSSSWRRSGGLLRNPACRPAWPGPDPVKICAWARVAEMLTRRYARLFPGSSSLDADLGVAEILEKIKA